MENMTRWMNCEFIDSDGLKQKEKVFFVDRSITSGVGTVYRLNGFVASGGNGSVFICYHGQSNEKLAVKLLRVIDAIRRERFDFESILLADLEHTNILALRDAGSVEMTHRYPIPFIITDFFETNVEREVNAGRLFSIAEIKVFGKQICEAFQYLHTQGIIHRDIKPGNFLIKSSRSGATDQSNLIVVSDFGLAKTYTEEGKKRFWRGDITTDDERVGSIPWMSPELFKYASDKTATVDSRSDILSIGRVLWYMHTGDIVGDMDRDDDQSGGHLFDLVKKAVQKKPEKRFQTAEELGTALVEMC